jgi:hypothetical protein
MSSRSAGLAAILATVVGIGALLTGCAPAAPTSHNHSPEAGGTALPSVSPTVTPTPVPTSGPPVLGPLPANALFRITAIAVQPDGATVDLTETVYAPSASNPTDAALLTAQCNGSGFSPWTSYFPAGYKFVDMTADAQARQGTPTFNSNATIAVAFGGEVSAYSGDYQTAQAVCAYGSIKAPGNMHGVTVVPATNSAKSSLGWAASGVFYGFDGDGNDPSDPNGGGGNTVVKGCAITISPTALAAAPSIAAWSSQPYDASQGCYYTVP